MLHIIIIILRRILMKIKNMMKLHLNFEVHLKYSKTPLNGTLW